VQWTQIIIPLCLIAIATYFSDAADSLCEYFTRAVKIDIWPIASTTVTLMLLTQP